MDLHNLKTRNLSQVDGSRLRLQLHRLQMIVLSVISARPLICNAIKQNESEVKLSFFLTDCIHNLQSYTFLQQTKLKLVNWFQRYGQLKGCKKTTGKKDINCFVWLYVKISICEFQLTLLDHITYI